MQVRNISLLLNIVLLTSFSIDEVTSFAPTKLSLSKHNKAILFADKVSTTTDTNDGQEVTLPDYGKTSVEIDQHKLTKKQRKKDEKKSDNKWRRPDLYGKSLISQTMEEIDNNIEFQETTERLKEIGQKGMSREERAQRRRALDSLGIPSFAEFIASKQQSKANDEEQGEQVKEFNIVQRNKPEVLQLNVGLYCNQACGHCHVESSPLRTEMMSKEVAAQCLEILKNTPSIHTLDITGGAPEMNANFRYLVSMARAIRGKDLDIIDRCNLTVLQEPGQEDLIDFLVEHDVHVIASLPCYSAENVDTQRGSGVFERSISALLALNEVGYGHPSNNDNDKKLLLDLVYNPLGAFLPPSQADLEIQYKKVLAADFDIIFGSLFTMTNMPVKRFADFLHKRDELKDYMDLLVRNFNPETLDSLMCTNTISVGYDGKMFDCDFNQQLGYTIGSKTKEGPKTVFDISSLDDLKNSPIRTDNHCFGCTAGMGSS